MRAPRRGKKVEDKADEPTRYFVMDPNAKELNGRRLTDDDRKNGILLTQAEAAHYIAGGSISEEDPRKDEEAKAAVKAKTKGGAVGGVGGGVSAGNPDSRDPVGEGESQVKS